MSGGSTTYTSGLAINDREQVYDADIQDGRPRHDIYQSNLDGEIVQRDTVNSSLASISGPHARYWYFGGQQMGDVSNDGTSDIDYITSIKDHTVTPGSGLFQNGATSGSQFADFDQSYDAVNGLTYQSAQSSYTAQDGDTLQSIAQQIWGELELLVPAGRGQRIRR